VTFGLCTIAWLECTVVSEKIPRPSAVSESSQRVYDDLGKFSGSSAPRPATCPTRPAIRAGAQVIHAHCIAISATLRAISARRVVA
jgi:hypothetical protein